MVFQVLNMGIETPVFAHLVNAMHIIISMFTRTVWINNNYIHTYRLPSVQQNRKVPSVWNICFSMFSLLESHINSFHLQVIISWFKSKQGKSWNWNITKSILHQQVHPNLLLDNILITTDHLSNFEWKVINKWEQWI